MCDLTCLRLKECVIDVIMNKTKIMIWIRTQKVKKTTKVAPMSIRMTTVMSMVVVKTQTWM